MKKGCLIFVLIAVFGACLWLGFRVTDRFVLPGSRESSAEPTPRPNQQVNMLIVSIDSFDAERPRLVSAWVLFAVAADPSPSLMFLPVYAEDGRYAGAAHLGEIFALTSTGKPTGEFEKAVLQYIHLDQIDQFVVIDRQGAALFANLFPNALPSPQPYQVAALDDHVLIQSLCATLSSRGPGVQLNIDWAQLVPNHFRTEMDFPTFVANWVKFTSSNAVTHCEVLGNPGNGN